MATAHVAGVAALLFSHFPDCTNNQIRNAMIRSATKAENTSDWDERYGWGIVNAGKAYELLKNGCVYAGGVHHNDTESGIPSDQARGGKDQIAVGASTPVNALLSRYPTVPHSAPPTMTPAGTHCNIDPNCGATLDTWTGIGGWHIDDLRFGTNGFTLMPTSSTRLTHLLQSPANNGDNYGSRMTGWLVPPVSGNYSFWIASDDQGEFWLSSNNDPANKDLTCFNDVPRLNTWIFSKLGNMSLVADQAYYYEVRWSY
jgi:hypothetical protein